MLTLILAAVPCLATQADHPLAQDRTGIEWVYPFEKTLERAREEQRLILMLPLAGGTNAAGNW